MSLESLIESLQSFLFSGQFLLVYGFALFLGLLLAFFYLMEKLPQLHRGPTQQQNALVLGDYLLFEQLGDDQVFVPNSLLFIVVQVLEDLSQEEDFLVDCSMQFRTEEEDIDLLFDRNGVEVFAISAPHGKHQKNVLFFDGGVEELKKLLLDQGLVEVLLEDVFDEAFPAGGF